MQNCIGQLDRARSAVTCHTNDVIQDVTEKYWMSLLVKNMQSHVPRAIWSFSALIKCAHAIFQISDRSQTLYKTVCITSWTECNFIQQ